MTADLATLEVNATSLDHDAAVIHMQLEKFELTNSSVGRQGMTHDCHEQSLTRTLGTLSTKSHLVYSKNGI